MIDRVMDVITFGSWVVVGLVLVAFPVVIVGFA